MRPRALRLLAHAPPIWRAGKPEPMRGDRTYSGPATSPPTGMTDPAKAAMQRVCDAKVHEQRREALYRGCERAPQFGPQHRNLLP